MPVLPTEFYSNYYLVEWVFNGTTTGFIASKFEAKLMNDASQTLLIQGKTGIAAQNIPTQYYQYTIEAPMLITNQNQYSYLSPYNSLTPLAFYLINIQWAAMNLGYSNPINTIDVILENFSINYSESETTQLMTIYSNIDLIDSGYFNTWFANENPNFQTIMGLVSRQVKNYDIFLNMTYNDYNETLYTLFTENYIFIESGKFEIKFDIDKKYFINQAYISPTVTFELKNYNFSQSYGIIGFADSTLLTDYFQSGLFVQRNTRHILQISGESPSILLDFQTPTVVKTTSKIFNEGQLIKTDFDFSFFGVTFSPENSPYGVGNLLYLYN